MSHELPAHLRQYLEYVRNAGGAATIEMFDEDWDPIGPMLRAEMMPKFVTTNAAGKLELTETGAGAIAESA